MPLPAFASALIRSNQTCPCPTGGVDVVDVAWKPLTQVLANRVDLAHLRELVREEDDVAGVPMARGRRAGASERGGRDESEGGRETNDGFACVSNAAHRSFLSLRCPLG